MYILYAHNELKRSFFAVGLELGIPHERARQIYWKREAKRVTSRRPRYACHTLQSGEPKAEREQLFALLEALILAAVDMNDVSETASYLLDEHPAAKGHGGKLPWHVRRTLETGMFITYARPFTASRGRPSMQPARGLSNGLRAGHDNIVYRRNRVYAHTDRTSLRRILELGDPREREVWVREGGDPREEWFPPTPEGLRELSTLAQAHLAAFLEEMGDVRNRIGAQT